MRRFLIAGGQIRKEQEMQADVQNFAAGNSTLGLSRRIGECIVSMIIKVQKCIGVWLVSDR